MAHTEPAWSNSRGTGPQGPGKLAGAEKRKRFESWKETAHRINPIARVLSICRPYIVLQGAHEHEVVEMLGRHVSRGNGPR